MLKEYEIEVVEVLSRTIAINATSREEAQKIARSMYRNEEIVLDSDDWISTEIDG